MKRRDALKNMAWSVGGTLATPTLLSILNSCSNQETDWTSEFFNASEKCLVEYLTNMILSSDSLVVINQLNISQFIDKMMKHTTQTTEQELFRQGAEAFKTKFEMVYKKEVFKGREEEFRELFGLFFNLSEDREQQVFEELRIPVNEVPQHKKSNYFIYKFLIKVRYYCLLGYFTSQEVIENNPYHNDNIGYYTGCTDL